MSRSTGNNTNGLPDDIEGVHVDTGSVETVDTTDAPEARAEKGSTRREVLGMGVRGAILLALAKFGVVGAKEALAQGLAPDGQNEAAQLKEEAEHMVHDSLALTVLDAIGTVAFWDAIISMARNKDSVVQQLCVVIGLPTYNTGEVQHHNGHEIKKFPLENIHFAAILNVIRMVAFGPDVRKHTIHEFETTLKGVGLLMGLTSMAKGIVETEGKALKMAEGTDKQADPEKVLGDSIFQLTAVAAATQLPLTAFGNAAIGNGEFGQVKSAMNDIYSRLLPSQREGEDLPAVAIRTSIRRELGNVKNEQVKKRVETILKNHKLNTYQDFEKALKEEAVSHTNDLMTILMSTACDDSQAAAGDAGPLVGLYQSFGIDFLNGIPSILPYTIMIGIERALLAAERTGIPKDSIFTKERIKYLKDFVLITWKNLILYFATVAPKISSKISGTASEKITGPRSGNGVGRDFTLVEQILKDAESIIGSAMDACLGSFNGNTLDIRKVRIAIITLQKAEGEFKGKVGAEVVSKVKGVDGEQTATMDRSTVDEIRDDVVGKKSEDKKLRDLQGNLEKLALDPNEKGIAEFAAHLKEMREKIGPELEKALHQLTGKEGKETPSIMAVAEILKANPRIKDLLDVNYWEHRIGSELTDTMFVVFLQGLHLPFLINTAERAVYNAGWFKKLPLQAQEIFSVLLNNGVSMFADNWADCVAHSKWLTTMYFNDLGKYVDELTETYPDIKKKIDEGYFEDDSTLLIPDRFKTRTQQFTALIVHLKSSHPEAAKKLDTMLEEYMDKAETYYWKSLNMAMLPAVTGGGKAKTGNAPHFTFAAGENDFTLAETLRDFKRHPVYHVWELIFSTGYSTIVGPAFSKYISAPALGKLGLSRGVPKAMQDMLKEQFRSRYPEFEKKMKELQAKKHASNDSNPGKIVDRSRRRFFSGGLLG